MSRIILETNNIFTKPKRIANYTLDEDVSEYLKETHNKTTVNFLYRDCPVRITEGRMVSFYADDFVKIKEELLSIVEAAKEKKKKKKKESVIFDATTNDLVVEKKKD